MRKKILALAAMPLVVAFLGGCGSSGHSTPPPSDNVPVVLSISDTAASAVESLPAGVNLISVQASVTGACLLTLSDSSTAACPVGQSLLPSGASVQFSALTNPSQLDTLSNTAVTANTYVSLALMFGSPISETISVDPRCQLHRRHEFLRQHPGNDTVVLPDLAGREHYNGRGYVREPNHTHRRNSGIVYRWIGRNRFDSGHRVCPSHSVI